MKKSFFLAAALSAYAALATTEIEVSSVEVDQERSCVKVQYRLSGDETIITARFFLDDEPIEEKYYANLAGDVNRLVKPTSEGECRKIYWQMNKLWTDRCGNGVFSVELTAYSKSSPPDYMVFDLQSPTNIPYNSVRFYTSTNALPGGIGDIVYRKEKMVFRRIPAAGIVWKMGSPENENGSASFVDETQHLVLLTNDYYMAVFETTYGQSAYLYPGTKYEGRRDHEMQNDAVWGDPACPQAYVQYLYLRSNSDCGMDGREIKEGEQDDLILAKLRKRSGIKFDLPTEAEWEFACRAGTGAALNSNVNLGSGYWDMMNPSSCTRLAWYYGTKESDGTYVKHPVGLKVPNAWGLYDMHGNVAELCYDAYGAYDVSYGVVTNPCGAASVDAAKGHAIRGGYYEESASNVRSARRSKESKTGAFRGYGFRMTAPIPLVSGDEGALSGATVTLPGELGQYESSGVESGYWDVSARPPRTVVRSAVVSTEQAVSYDTRWYGEAAATLLEMYRDFTGMLMIFR